jgi:hypothetical protein
MNISNDEKALKVQNENRSVFSQSEPGLRRSYQWRHMRKLCYVVLAGFALAAVLIFFFGDSGLASYGSLSGFRDRLSENVGELESINQKLSSQLDSLKRSPSAAEVLAGSLGLYAPKDRVILLEDTASRRVSYDAGKLIRPVKQREGGNFIYKIIGSAMILFCILGAFIFRGFARKRARYDYRGG